MKDKVKRGGRNQPRTDVAFQTSGNGSVGMKQEEDSFPVKIQGAGVEPFELQVHGFWFVQEVTMALLTREEVCPRSSLSLAFAGVTLDPLAELLSVKGLKPGSVLRLVEEPYSPRSARVHLGRVLELLRKSGPQDALREGRSPSILETLTHTPDSGLSSGKSLKRSSSNTKSEPNSQDGVPPENLLPGSLERPLMALLPHSSQQEATVYLRDLSLSCWNPPPGPRKLQGDFFYLTVVTLEGRRYDITSCPRGFCVNRSTEELFDPRPAQSSPVCHCLTDLLCHISPTFKQGLTNFTKRSQLPPAEVMPTPYRTLSWLGPSCASHTHKNSFSRLGLDEQAQAPDWNEELQAARDLPQGSLEERLHRDRALLQVNSAFVWAVTQGAEAVMDGFVEPVNRNPEDPAFLFDGLFMTRGAASALLSGEKGRRAGQRLELKGVQAYSDLDVMQQGLHTLPTAIVDYRGVRLSAQGLAPGLEASEQEQGSSTVPRGLLYGVNSRPQESPHRRRLLELLAQSAKALSLQRHVVIAPNGYQVPLFTSVDAQGLMGADGRFYLLDVFRTFPADANFLPVICQEEEKIPSSMKEEGWPENYGSDTGLPRSYSHGLCRLRPELIKAFVQHKHSHFTQRFREMMEENGGFEECATAGDSRGTDAMRAACKEVGSVSNIIFELRFNPNVFSPGVSFPDCEGDSTELQERLLREAAAFIITHQLPAFLEYCLQSNDAPMDGASLKQALHQRGINLRYLGHVIKAISQSENSERLRHITRLVIGEIVVRTTRRIFNSFLQGAEVSILSAAVSHFLCCLLVPHFSPTPVGEESKKKSRRRGRGASASDTMIWSTLTGTELWSLIQQDAVETYDITDCLGSGPNHLVEQYGLQKLSLLREFCLRTGVQLRLRDYFLDNQSKAPIGPDDVLNIFPVIKHINMPIIDATKSFRAAQNFIQKGLMDKAHDSLKEAAYLFGRVCDDLHPEACRCLSLLARVAFLQGQAAEARSVQLKVVVISEKVFGFDHPNTIQQYVLLAVYVYAGGEHALAQKCLLRARQLILTVHGEDHPYTATIDSCLGLVLTGEQAGAFLQSALRLTTSFFGATHLYTGLTQHLLSQWMCSRAEYRAAMNHEKEAFAAFTSTFGEDHPQTRASSEYLCTVTQQAVRVARSLRQAGAEQTDQAVACLTPATDTILEQLVLVTGIKRLAQSDRLQEFKQKLLEQKAVEATEESNRVTGEIATSDTVKRGEESDDKHTDYVNGVEDGENPVDDNVSKSPCDALLVSSAIVSVNGHTVEPADQKTIEKGDGADVDKSSSEVELTQKMNGETETGSTGEEIQPPKVNEEERRTNNGGLESNVTVNMVGKLASDEISDSNGSLDITTDLSELTIKDVMADVTIPKTITTSGTGDESRAGNRVAEGSVIANGVA